MTTQAKNFTQDIPCIVQEMRRAADMMDDSLCRVRAYARIYGLTKNTDDLAVAKRCVDVLRHTKLISKAYLEIMRACIKAGNFTAARECADAFTKPCYSTAYTELGLAYIEEHNVAAARECVEMEENPFAKLTLCVKIHAVTNDPTDIAAARRYAEGERDAFWKFRSYARIYNSTKDPQDLAAAQAWMGKIDNIQKSPNMYEEVMDACVSMKDSAGIRNLILRTREEDNLCYLYGYLYVFTNDPEYLLTARRYVQQVQDNSCFPNPLMYTGLYRITKDPVILAEARKWPVGMRPYDRFSNCAQIYRMTKNPEDLFTVWRAAALVDRKRVPFLQVYLEITRVCMKAGNLAAARDSVVMVRSIPHRFKVCVKLYGLLGDSRLLDVARDCITATKHMYLRSTMHARLYRFTEDPEDYIAARQYAEKIQDDAEHRFAAYARIHKVVTE